MKEKRKNIFVAPFSPYDVSYKLDEYSKEQCRIPFLYFIAPIRDTAKNIIAVLAVPFDPSKEISYALQTVSTGETGETFLFDSKARMLTESAFTEQLRTFGLLNDLQSSVLNIELRDPGVDLSKGIKPKRPKDEHDLTKMAQHAVDGGAGIDVIGYPDYRGVMVFGAWRWHKELEIGIASEIDISEGLANFHLIRKVVALIVCSALLLAVFVALYTLLAGERTNRVLADARDNLEHRVDERTKELSNQKELMENTIESLTHPFYVIDANNYRVMLANSAALKSSQNQETTCHALTHKSETPCDSTEHPCPLKTRQRNAKTSHC